MSKLVQPVIEEDEEDLGAFWLITYSDMITLLFAFFLLIFSFSQLSENSQDELVRSLNLLGEPIPGARAAAAPDSMEQTAQEIAALMKVADDPEKAWLVRSERAITLVLPSSLTFRSGDAALLSEAEATLRQLAAKLRDLPNPIHVAGHTDDVPIRTPDFPSNWHLSVARAQSVVKVFLSEGIAAPRVHVVGYGPTRPRAGNDTPEGRSMNRRIEIELLREQP